MCFLGLWSAYVRDTRLGICFGSRRPRRQLKHRRLLALIESCQENYASIWKFEGIVVLEWFVPVDLSKDCRRVI
jgi:hypothetical protein